MSPFAAAWIGLRGTILTSRSMLSAFSDSPIAPWVWPLYVSIRRALIAASRPRPGWKTFMRTRPSTVEAAVRPRKLTIVSRPMRPSRFRLPRPATPRESVETISGMTIMIRADSHILPIGSVTSVTNRCVPGPPPVRRLTVTPAAAPASRPRRILLWSFIGVSPFPLIRSLHPCSALRSTRRCYDGVRRGSIRNQTPRARARGRTAGCLAGSRLRARQPRRR